MRATPESKVKASIDKVLKSYAPACFYHKPVLNGMGKPTLDYVGVCCGLFFAIEAKAPGEAPTPRQELTIKEMRRAKGKVFVIDGSADALRELDEWLTYCVTRYVEIRKEADARSQGQ